MKFDNFSPVMGSELAEIRAEKARTALKDAVRLESAAARYVNAMMARVATGYCNTDEHAAFLEAARAAYRVFECEELGVLANDYAHEVGLCDDPDCCEPRCLKADADYARFKAWRDENGHFGGAQ